MEVVLLDLICFTTVSEFCFCFYRFCIIVFKCTFQSAYYLDFFRKEEETLSQWLQSITDEVFDKFNKPLLVSFFSFNQYQLNIFQNFEETCRNIMSVLPKLRTKHS